MGWEKEIVMSSLESIIIIIDRKIVLTKVCCEVFVDLRNNN